MEEKNMQKKRSRRKEKGKRRINLDPVSWRKLKYVIRIKYLGFEVITVCKEQPEQLIV